MVDHDFHETSHRLNMVVSLVSMLLRP